ncbi:hypothetical protein MRX96_023257 [Rhipicephalus microplus]
MQHRVDQFLFTYRNTPCSTTGKTPAELFLSWRPRTRLSILHPELAKRAEANIARRQAGSVWIPEQTRMAQSGSTPSQSDSDTASPPDGPAPEQRLPPPDRASVTELPSQQAPDASSQENVAPPELRRSTRIRKPPERFGYAAK